MGVVESCGFLGRPIKIFFYNFFLYTVCAESRTDIKKCHFFGGGFKKGSFSVFSGPPKKGLFLGFFIVFIIFIIFIFIFIFFLFLFLFFFIFIFIFFIFVE